MVPPVGACELLTMKGEIKRVTTAFTCCDPQAVNAETVDAPLTLSAESGWGLTNYTQTRSAAPFAILDSMISATLYALQGRSALSFEPIDVYWSEANTLDNVGTSYFSGTYIMISG